MTYMENHASPASHSGASRSGSSRSGSSRPEASRPQVAATEAVPPGSAITGTSRAEMSRAGGSAPHPREVVTRRALVVWVAGVACYIVAITGRTSFGVAGVEAIARFDVDASRIAVFAAVQLGVYALAQIPTGLGIDRFGPRAVVMFGAVVMGLGQFLLALTTSYPLAIVARVLIGAGDASAFLAVMRLLPYWFPLRKTPLFTQLTGAIGQTGQFISAVPFLALLGSAGWTGAFVTLGATSILLAGLAGLAIKDLPDVDRHAAHASESGTAASRRDSLRTRMRTLLRTPVAWQGFFMHYSCLMFQLVFLMMWGFPLMTLGMGLSAQQAGAVLAINTVVTVFSGPLHGLFSARISAVRHWAVVGFSVTIVLTWAVFFASATPRGLTAIVVVNVIVALCASSANYGFDNVREGVPREVVATATGLANMGGFLAGMAASQGIGVVLDISSAGSEYAWGDFQVAALAAGVVWAVGVIGLLVASAWRKYPGPAHRILPHRLRALRSH